jgi:hypothetical protein
LRCKKKKEEEEEKAPIEPDVVEGSVIKKLMIVF